MVTSVAAPASRRSLWRIAFKVLIGLVLLAVVGVAGAFAWFYRATHASLAQLDGTITVTGLASPVSVVRDVHGVPHLTAGSLEDLFFAQGYVTAQDRLWQMDMTRRAAAGELSEILGAAPLPSGPARSKAAPAPRQTFVDYDKTQRILRLRYVADRVTAQLPERDRSIFAAYARGVNAYIVQHRKQLPIEFRILGYAPRDWSAADSVLVGIAMSQLLNPQYGIEYWRERLGQRLSPELMADLYPVDSWRDHAPGVDGGKAPVKPQEHISKVPIRLDQRGAVAESPALRAILLAAPSASSVENPARVPLGTQGPQPPSAALDGALGTDIGENAADRRRGRLRSTRIFISLGELKTGELKTHGDLGQALEGPLKGSLSRNPGDDCASCLPGSNNWVVSGAHTTTGKPLLSNDMHLPHRFPAVWYEMQLHAGEFNVEGFTLPGMPLVVVGHNQQIAWGFTNLNPDVQDLFIETFNEAGEYQTPSGWKKPETDHQVIHVKGQPDVLLDVVITRHGPIVSDLFPAETRKIALQWVLYDTRSISIPLFDLDSSQNWEQFRKALSVFATPSQNVVYGDVEGNIGYQAMGFVPLRASGDGALPVSGADSKHDWTGYLAFDKMPSVYNPPSGIIATANSKITPPGYPSLLSTQWFPPYRTQRIYQLLDEPGRKFSAADMLALQTDITSGYDRLFAARFVEAVDRSSKAGPRTHEAADIMRGFDGVMRTDSAAATIEVKARQALWELLLEPKLGADWVRYDWSESSVALENIVESRPQRWLSPGYSNFDDLLTAAVELALQNAPSNLKSWHYGQEFPLEIRHSVLGAIPGLGHWAGPGRVPQSGGSFTVKQVGRSLGPSERMTVDFSNLDASTFNIVLGESGQVFSPYYMDHWPAWYGNMAFTLAYTDEAVREAEAHELFLKSRP